MRTTKQQTKQEALAELQAKHNKEIQQLEREYAVIEALQLGPEFDGYEPPSIHHFNLYGSRGGIHFRPAYSDILAKGKSPDSQLLRYLLDKFPPLPLTLYKDGCTGFRPSFSVTPEMEEKAIECLNVCPVTVKIDDILIGTPRAEFYWFAHVGVDVWNLHVSFPLWSTDLGELRLEVERYPDGEVKRVEHCDFIPKHGAQRIRYAAGTHKSANPFVVWWDIDTGKGVDFPAIAQKQK